MNLGQALSVLNLKGVKFAYAVGKNLEIIKSEVNALMKSQEASKEYQEFDKQRIELASEMSNKDEKGNPIIENNNYQIQDLIKFKKALDILKGKHKKAVDAREKQVKEFEELLQEKTKVKLHKIKLAEVPDDISTQQMASIMVIIQE